MWYGVYDDYILYKVPKSKVPGVQRVCMISAEEYNIEMGGA